MAAAEQIGRYRLTRRLGTGAFATVWLGHDDELDAPVAIKVLADNWAADADVRARFVAEARLLRRVRDQRVVRVHDIGALDDDRPYFVMDYADGGTVATLLADDQRLDPAAALRLGADIAGAVQVLHDHGFAHRDIKPGNLLLTNDSGRTDAPTSVVIADLGMAKSLAEASGYTLTVGTPAYMAPEQALGLGFDQRADVYGIAAVTYTLLAGQPPFPGAGLVEIAERSRDGDPPPLGLGPAVDRVLADALAYDPDRRPASAGELAGVLNRLADLVEDPEVAEDLPALRPTTRRVPAGSSVAALTTAEPVPVPAVATVRPRTGVVVAIAVALAVVVALLTWVLLSYLA